MRYRELIEIAIKNGWSFSRHGKGSHELWRKEGRNDLPIPNHGGKELNVNLVKGLIKKLKK